MAQIKSKTLVDVREHVLYCGVTQTGKTTLARHHARILSKAEYDVVVYDPVGTVTAGGGWPDDALIIKDQARFDKYIEQARGEPERPVFLFVDESADIFGHSMTENHWVPRKIRHNDIYLRLIVQRPKMLHPSVRTQCAYAYMLRLSQDDAKILCADFGHGSEVSQITLDKGDCVLLESGSSAIEEFNVFDQIDRNPQSTNSESEK